MFNILFGNLTSWFYLRFFLIKDETRFWFDSHGKVSLFFLYTLFVLSKNASVRMYSREEKVQSESKVRTESENPAGSVKCGEAGFAGGALSIPVALPVVLAAPRTGSRTNGHLQFRPLAYVFISTKKISYVTNERNKELPTLKRQKEVDNKSRR